MCSCCNWYNNPHVTPPFLGIYYVIKVNFVVIVYMKSDMIEICLILNRMGFSCTLYEQSGLCVNRRTRHNGLTVLSLMQGP